MVYQIRRTENFKKIINKLLKSFFICKGKCYSTSGIDLPQSEKLSSHIKPFHRLKEEEFINYSINLSKKEKKQLDKNIPKISQKL